MVEEIDAILDKSGKTVCGTWMSLLDCSRRWLPIPVFCMSLLINTPVSDYQLVRSELCMNCVLIDMLPTPCSLLPTPWAGARTGIGKRWFTGLHNSEDMWLILFFSSVSGTTVFAEIQGVIDACVKLSGMPDLTLSFMVRALIHIHLFLGGGGGYIFFFGVINTI